MIVHPIVFGLKYNLNFLKRSFIPWRLFSGSGGLSRAIFCGHFSLGINFSRRISPIIDYFLTIFLKRRINSLICIDVLWLTLNMREAFLQYASLHAFFISNARLKLAKSQANAKQHPEAKLLTCKNCLHSSSTLSSNNNRTYSKK